MVVVVEGNTRRRGGQVGRRGQQLWLLVVMVVVRPSCWPGWCGSGGEDGGLGACREGHGLEVWRGGG